LLVVCLPAFTWLFLNVSGDRDGQQTSYVTSNVLLKPYTSFYINYPPGVICNPSGGNAEPKTQCCSTLWAITAKYWG